MDARYKIGRITLPRLARHLRYAARLAVAPPGRLPDVVIVGTMKGGTTSLFSYLCEHPEVHGSIRKEVHFFDRHFRRGMHWYRKHFPRCRGGVVVEATPTYMFHRNSLDRMRTVLPGAKLIALLRDPVTRAYSHYQHSLRKGTESRSFQEAVRADLQVDRVSGALGDDTWQSNEHSYIRRGIYAPQIRRIMYVYGSALLVLRSEDLFADPLRVTNAALRFVGLPQVAHISDIEPKTSGKYNPDIPMFQELQDFFSPHNDELYQLLQSDPWWPSAGEVHAADAKSAA